MQTKFKLDTTYPTGGEGEVKIIGTTPSHKPYVSFRVNHNGAEFSGCVRDRDLERFAVNILKAIKSEKLK